MLKARKCSETLQDAVNDWQSDHVILGALGTSGEGCGGTDRTVRRMLAGCEWLHVGSSARRRGFSPGMTSYEVRGEKCDSGAGLCPIFLSFSLVMATLPLFCNYPSPCDSPDDAARHCVLVLVGSFICGYKVSIKQWLTPKELKPNLALLFHRGFKSWPAEWIFWLTFLVVVLSLFRRVPVWQPRLGDDQFLPYAFQFIVNVLTTYHLALRSVSEWQPREMSRKQTNK